MILAALRGSKQQASAEEVPPYVTPRATSVISTRRTRWTAPLRYIAQYVEAYNPLAGCPYLTLCQIDGLVQRLGGRLSYAGSREIRSEGLFYLEM